MTSSCYRTADENETFFREGLEKLRNEKLQENSGKLIRDLMEIQADKVLVHFAKAWLKEFPSNENAPRLVGNWLAKYKTNDAAYLAISYVKTYPDVKALGQIIGAASQLPGRPQKLYSAIEKRLDKDPNSHVWGFLQNKGHSDKFVDDLLVRWIQRNLSSGEIVGSLSGVALFTQSKQVLEEATRWAEIHQSMPNYFWMVLSHLLCGKSQAHEMVAPRVSELARAWIKRNPEDEFCGTIFENLVLRTKSLEDLRNAKEWYGAHTDSSTASNALRGILHVMHSMGEPADLEVVGHAKRILAAKAPGDRGGITGVLLRACPDEDSVRIATETVMEREMAWLLADLLKIAPGAKLITRANEMLATKTEEPPELIVEMLKIDRSNDVAKQAAKRWLRKYPDHDQVKTVKGLLQEKSNGKQ